jgi:hypothetical protein
MRCTTVRVLSLAAALTQASAQVTPITQWYTTAIAGKATYYGNYAGRGACLLDQVRPPCHHTHTGIEGDYMHARIRSRSETTASPPTYHPPPPPRAHLQGNGVWVPPELSGIDFTVAMNKQQYNAGSCGMCIELTGGFLYVLVCVRV